MNLACCLSCWTVLLLSGAPGAAIGDPRSSSVVLFEDGFGELRAGLYFSVAGARAEYHYLSECAPKGKWAVSTFVSDESSQRAWRVGSEGGQPLMLQAYGNNPAKKPTHPMLVAGDELWSDYTLHVRFAPESPDGQSGVAFRYRNDRCFYFFGVHRDKVLLKMVRHETAFHELFERVLAQHDYAWKPGSWLTAEVTVSGSKIHANLNGDVSLSAEDNSYAQGKIGLTSDVPTRYAKVVVTASTGEANRVENARLKRQRELAELQAANPKLVPWKKVKTEGFGVGRNLRFGDLNRDGKIDFLVGQVMHHGPKDTNSEVSCLTAMTFDGRMLWQIGRPDAWKNHLTNDVAMQIHDLDGDGRNEVIYCMNMELVVADGLTGKTKVKVPTPESPKGGKPPHNRFARILGDSLYFCDLRGQGRRGDIILKDRYEHIWALNDRLQIMWQVRCNTGHYPFAYDVDGDGRDELAVGYSLLDDDGKSLWTLDKQLNDHADGVAIVRFDADEKAEPRLVCAASDEGVFFTNLRGSILSHLRLGHVQNPAVADFRTDLPGLELITMNFWGNQGIVHFFDARGNVYHDFEPYQFGSMCLPINWTGKPPEYWVLAPSVADGGIYDGWGRRVVAFPGDGHPEMCYSVLDVTGDCRDEVIVWDPAEVWVYTQDDNPKQGKLYKPRRNPLCNESNYQAAVSLPGWSE